jgi:hypothetical protein
MKNYVYELGGILHAGVEGLDLFLFGLGIHGRRHVSINVEPCLNEVRVVPQGLCNTQILSRLFFEPRHRWAFT